MSEEEIKAAALECMRHVCDEVQKGHVNLNYFNGTYSFEQCIRRGLEKVQTGARQSRNVKFPDH